MKSLVVYSSRTGTTKKLAEAVYESLDEDKVVHNMEESPDPSGFDLVCVGF